MKGKLSDLFLSSKESVIIKPDLAVKLGLNEAIVLRQIYYWLEINEKLQRNYYDGRYWTFNTMEEWQKNNFPWWSTKTIERAFKSLISSGIVITGNYNKDQRDRTKWYSINEDVLENILNGIVKENPKTNSQCASGQNDERHRQNDEMHKDSSGEALPENTFKDYHSETNETTSYDVSSVITILIDGKEIESCGDTCIFEQKGLKPEVDFTQENIISHSTGKISENTYIAGIVNYYKNYFGKSRVVVIKSQLGQPIAAYSGDEVFWKIPDDLPKMTKLMIDGKALYIHRANFQIIDKELLR